VLQEFTTVKQEPGGHRRRWFQGDGLDLIIWLDERQQPEGFQICYLDQWRQEYALTWRAQTGFAHARIDTGDSRPDKNLTPILAEGGPVTWDKLREEFQARSSALESTIREFVTTRLAEGKN